MNTDCQPSPAPRCDHDGTAWFRVSRPGFETGHRCLCIRRDGHPATDPHTCECGVSWTITDTRVTFQTKPLSPVIPGRFAQPEYRQLPPISPLIGGAE